MFMFYFQFSRVLLFSKFPTVRNVWDDNDMRKDYLRILITHIKVITLFSSQRIYTSNS